jgi:hypothetical protein
MIRTAQQANPIARKRGARHFFRLAAEERGFRMAEGPPTGPALDAVINHGRWLVHCPDAECRGAELVDPDDPFFFCLSCGNAARGGTTIVVIFPTSRLKIEAALNVRRIEHQNWLPGETVDALEAENREHGLTS